MGTGHTEHSPPSWVGWVGWQRAPLLPRGPKPGGAGLTMPLQLAFTPTYCLCVLHDAGPPQTQCGTPPVTFNGYYECYPESNGYSCLGECPTGKTGAITAICGPGDSRWTIFEDCVTGMLCACEHSATV